MHPACQIDRYKHSPRRGTLSRSMWASLRLAPIIASKTPTSSLKVFFIFKSNSTMMSSLHDSRLYFARSHETAVHLKCTRVTKNCQKYNVIQRHCILVPEVSWVRGRRRGLKSSLVASSGCRDSMAVTMHGHSNPQQLPTTAVRG